MADKHEQAHDMAEQGIEKIIAGDRKTGEKLIEKAKKLDPSAVEELAEEAEKDKEEAERFSRKQ